jgi:ribose transport system ATP-binding protein
MTRARLQAVGLSKTFGVTHALKDVSVDIGANEVVGLIGENGAGKSTLMRILAGVQQPTSGELRSDGERLQLGSPMDAASSGIGMVFQEQSLLLNISVAENIVLGHERAFVRNGFIDWRRLHAEARAQLAKVGLDIDPSTRTADLGFSARQMVELAKALALEDRVARDLVILLDEPTSVLESADIEVLFERVRALKQRASFVFVSHRLDEVLAISDRVYVMRDGRVVASMAAADTTVPELHHLMVGRELHAEYYHESSQRPPSSEVVLEADALSAAGHYADVSFSLRRGEVLGIAGVVGSGREELVRTLFGFLPQTSGTLRVNGQRVRLQSPAAAVERGVGYVPRERRLEGLVMYMSIAANLTLANLGSILWHGLISRKREKVLADHWIRALSVRAAGADALCLSLSGGNQQKIVLAKWLVAGSRILILDHPTRGLDVGAKADVYRLVRDLGRDGVAVILAADTLEELIGMSHTIIVMRDGGVTARVDAPAGAKPAQIELIGHMV